MSYIGVVQPLLTSAFNDVSTTTNSARIQLQFPYNINTDEVTTTLTGSGTVTSSQPFAVCSTTAATSSSARLISKNNLHYRTGQGGVVFFTAIYTTGASGSTQLAGLGDSSDGLFFGYNGTAFGINRRYNGSDNWIPQTTWNYDKMNGTGPSLMTLDPTKGNVYKIQYQWLGFGCIDFFLENPSTATFVLVHRIQYPNANTTTTLLNPSVPLFLEAANTTNATNIVLKSASMAAFVQGLLVNTGLINSVFNSKSVTTKLNLFTIKNNQTFNSIENKKYVQVLMTSLAVVGNQEGTFSFTLNATLGGSPSYTNISTNTSVVSYDVAGTTVTGGRVLFTLFGNSSNQTIQDLSNLDVVLNPNDTLTVSCASSGSAVTAFAALMWNEQF